LRIGKIPPKTHPVTKLVVYAVNPEGGGPAAVSAGDFISIICCAWNPQGIGFLIMGGASPKGGACQGGHAPLPSFCEATIREGECLKRVNRVISSVRQSLPLYPQKPTFGCSAISVATGHVWTVPAVQEESDFSAKRSGAAMYTACFRLEDYL